MVRQKLIYGFLLTRTLATDRQINVIQLPTVFVHAYIACLATLVPGFSVQ